MKTIIVLFVLILLGVSGYYMYQHYKDNSSNQTVEPNVPGLSAPVNQAQNSVNSYNDSVQQGQNQAQKVQTGQ